jgi:hypothetical protein
VPKGPRDGPEVGQAREWAASHRRRYSSFETSLTSTSVALARRAPTVAWSRAMLAKGSKLKKRHAFFQVMASTSSSLHPASSSSASSVSGERGQVESEWG